MVSRRSLALAPQPPTKETSGPPGWLLCGLTWASLGEGGARLRAMKAAEAFRQQGEACAALGSRMYAELLYGLAHDIDRHGPTWRALRGHEDDPGPSGLALRLLGSVHRLVLERGRGWAGGVLPERRRSLERAARCAGVHRPGRTGPRGGAGVARPAAADQRGRAGDRADGRVAAPAGAAARAGAALRDRLLGRAEPAGRPVQLHRHDRQPVRRRSLAGPPATGLARRPPHAVARPRVRGDGRAATSTPSKRVRRRAGSP